MNTFSVDFEDFTVVTHTNESRAEFENRNGGGWVTRHNYDHLRRDFRKGRRFIKTANGYAELGVWG